MFEVRAPLMIRNDYSQATMKVEVYQKDIDIISAFAAALQCPTPLFEASEGILLGRLRARATAKQDTAAICAVLENMAGIVGCPSRAEDANARPQARRQPVQEPERA